MNQRFKHLMGALTAKERGILVLRSLKNKTEEDLNWRLMMPPNQRAQFNRYIDLMNGANMRLGYLITVLMKEVEKLELKQSWLFTLLLWEENRAEIDFMASILAREPISESDHRRLVETAAAEFVPVKTLARELAAHERRWTDEELEEFGWSSELAVRDEAMNRLCQEAEAEIRDAINLGHLDSQGKGKALSVRSGSFDTWLGRPPTVHPDWARGYEVRPDSEAPSIQRDLSTLANLREVLSKTPLDRLLEGKLAEEKRTLSGFAGRLAKGMADQALTNWHELRAVEVVIDEVAAEFDGEDPLKPVFRNDLNAAKDALVRLAEHLRLYEQPLELTEPPGEDIEGTRQLLEGGTRLLPR